MGIACRLAQGISLHTKSSGVGRAGRPQRRRSGRGRGRARSYNICELSQPSPTPYLAPLALLPARRSRFVLVAMRTIVILKACQHDLRASDNDRPHQNVPLPSLLEEVDGTPKPHEIEQPGRLSYFFQSIKQSAVLETVLDKIIRAEEG